MGQIKPGENQTSAIPRWQKEIGSELQLRREGERQREREKREEKERKRKKREEKVREKLYNRERERKKDTLVKDQLF